MDNHLLRITVKELFYSAMMLRLNRLVNVEYIFPADEGGRARELSEVKQTLRKKKLLKESAKGDVSMSLTLMACAIMCSNPEKCTIREAEGYYATAYGVAGSYMLLEKEDEGELAVSWYKDEETLKEYLSGKLNADGTETDGEEEVRDNGGANL